MVGLQKLMMFHNALRIDDTIVASGLNLQAAHSFSEAICGPHSVRVAVPSKFSLVYSGHLLKGMSSTVGFIEHGTELGVGVDAKQILDVYNISLPVSGEQELRSSHGRVRSDSDCALVVSPEQKLQIDLAGNCRKILVTIPRASLEQMLGDMLGRRVDGLVVFSEGMRAREGTSAAWWRMVKNYLAEIEVGRGLYGCSFVSQGIEATLVKGLLISQPNNYSDRIRQALGAKVPEYMTRARAFIELNFREPIHLEDIEAAAGVSRIKLFESFRKHTALTPVAYLKDFRLRQARAQLMQDQCSANVSSIALGVGFNHLGRFSLDYKRAFSETPSETIQRHARR